MKYIAYVISYLAFISYVAMVLLIALIVGSNEIYNPPICAEDAARRRKIRRKIITILLPIGVVVILARILIH